MLIISSDIQYDYDEETGTLIIGNEIKMIKSVYQSSLCKCSRHFWHAERSCQILLAACVSITSRLFWVLTGSNMLLFSNRISIPQCDRVKIEVYILCIYSRLKQSALTSNAILTLSSCEDAFAIANTMKIYSSRSIFPCPNYKMIYTWIFL